MTNTRYRIEGALRPSELDQDAMAALAGVQRERCFFTWSAQRSARPLTIVDADGARFRIADGRWIYDLESQVYNVAVGHRHPHVVARMIEQLEWLPAAAPNAILPVRAALGRLLADKTGLPKSFLTTGGSEAVENAVKIARAVTGRRKVVCRRRSYHGATLAMLAIAGDPRRTGYAPEPDAPLWIDDSEHANAPGNDGISGWLASFDAIIAREGGDSIAAVVLEGLTGTNGMQEPPEDFWTGVRTRCDRHGILLVVDEIFSGFGRTGRWFAREHWDVRVDMMTYGKGLTSGYAPLAGVSVSEAIAAHFEDHVLSCGLTHYAHPVACAAAVGAIEVIVAEDLVANAAAVGAHLAARLVAADVAAIQEVRGRGLMLAVALDRTAADVVERCWARDVFVPSRGDTLFVCPPLCLTTAQADDVADRLLDAIGRA